jgi:hypothetical protein
MLLLKKLNHFQMKKFLDQDLLDLQLLHHQPELDKLLLLL